MGHRIGLVGTFLGGLLVGSTILSAWSGETDKGKPPQKPRDPAAEALVQRDVKADRPEQSLTAHDRSNVFDPNKAPFINSALKDQPKQGKILGFDFARDPLGAPEPFTMFSDVMKKESAARPKVMADHRKLLATRYNLTAKRDEKVKMSRGKPICVGPTARLPEEMTWEKLAAMTPAEMKKQGFFPYP